MKVFIVFLAMLILSMGFITYASDMGRYVRLQAALKALAEECAAGGALFVDEERYSEGLIVIDNADAEAYVDFLIGRAAPETPPFGNGSISASVVIFDDEKGYEGMESYGLERRRPSVVARLTYASEDDIFRLPFLEAYFVSRTAVYQWEDGMEGF